ncbi:MAG TPA: thioredoxin [Longimicrobiales bacterium]|nr:thioredoxin [Longimicrobiales bacterium]
MSENGKVFEVTDDDFAEKIEETDGLAMVDFWAEWCGPCRIVAPIVAKLAEEYEERGVRVGKLDVESNPQTASRFGVRSIPSILFFLDGEHVDTVIGAVPRDHLERKIEEHLG